MGGKTPKLKYHKTLTEEGNFMPGGWAVAISNSKPVVYITTGSDMVGKTSLSNSEGVMVQPSISKDYK